MLQPEYFEAAGDQLIRIYQKVEDFILKDISRRIINAGEMTATADRLAYKLLQAGKSREAIEEEVAKYTQMSQEEVRKILQDAVLTSWAYDEEIFEQLGITVSPPLENANVIAVMDAEYQKTLGELENLTKTTMNKSQQDLIDLLDEVEVRVSSGVQSYNEAIADVLYRYAGKGVMVTYPKGTKRTLEAAVRCCVVTSMNQTSAQVTNQYIVQAGLDYVKVSQHIGARTKRPGQPDLADHSAWQGKVYKIRGEEPGYKNLLDSTGYDIDPVTGTGYVVDPLGLHGYNCRHSHQPWSKDLKDNNEPIDQKENKERYDLSQKQRAMERAIRATKRHLIVQQEQIDAAEDKEELQAQYDSMAYKLTQQNKAYNEFCSENGLATQYERNRVADFNRTQEKAANTAAKRYKKERGL